MPKIGLIGYPVSHSFSPVLFQKAFEIYGLSSWEYELIAIEPNEFEIKFQTLCYSGIIGCNVTTPYKERILKYTNSDNITQQIGAANTIIFPNMFHPIASTFATNTDIYGFDEDLQENLPNMLRKKAIILGAGGAARAAMYVLNKKGYEIMVINRTFKHASSMIDHIKIPAKIGTWKDIYSWQPNLVVQCTTVGMWPNIGDCIWPDDIDFPSGIAAYDMVYRPQWTKFLQKAQTAKSLAIPGIGMLAHQAAKAFFLFTKISCSSKIMLEAALPYLNK